MSIVPVIVLIYFGLLYILQYVQLYFLYKDKSEKINLPNEFPDVSVLVAVRNEEDCILECLQKLDKLDWPEDKIEILIGNDSSEDGTEAIVSSFILEKTKFKLIQIEGNIGLARGKANVLAQLTHQAKGGFFCITDADIRVPETWVKGLYGAWEPGYGTINGVTITQSGYTFSNFQRNDWIYAFSQVRVITQLRVPVSAVGNNMLISREAYFSTGGYENIPFSITEDFELFRQTLKKGWKYKNMLQEEVLAETMPLKTLAQFFHQRKRWMSGALQLPPILVLLLGIQGIMFLFLLLGMSMGGWLFLLWGIKVMNDIFFVKKAFFKIGKPFELKAFFIHEMLLPVMALAQMLYFALPGKVNWKGRRY